MTWILTICTAAWLMCGSVQVFEYPTEAQCHKAMDTLYNRQGKEAFKYITCSQKGVVK
jgi:hypothetical protein